MEATFACWWIKRWRYYSVYIYEYDYHLAIEKKEILLFAKTGMDFVGIRPNELSQTEKFKSHIISLTCEILKKLNS